MTTHAPTLGSAALAYLASGHQPPDALPAADPLTLPPVHKRYPSAARQPLPACAGPRDDDPARRLSWLLRQTNGLTRMRWMSGIMPLGLGTSAVRRDRGVLLSPGRTGASSGSRYPVEVYAATPGGAGLPAGLSHYDPVHHALEWLREGDGRDLLTSSLAEPPDELPEFVLLLSSVLWRNAAKYGVFGYRLQSLDVGVVTAQAAAAAAATGLSATVHLRYDDATLDEILGLTPFAESVFAVLTLHRPDVPAPHRPDGPPSAAAPTGRWRGEVPAARPGPVSVTGVPALGEVAALHAAIRAAAPGLSRPVPAWTPPPGASRHVLPAAALDVVDGFAGRRTVYGYRPGEVQQRTLGAVLAAAAEAVTADTPVGRTVRLAGVVQRVPGVETGAHLYDPAGHALVATRGSDAVAAVIGASKSPMLADECRTATAVLAPCGDLRTGVETFGDRWYRAQNIAAGALAQRVALAAAAAGLESHVHCDFDPEGVRSALGLAEGPLQPLVLVTVGPRSPDRTDPQLPLGAGV
ncbi:SagB/ThcOx family dehydrogenase [Streptomyces cyanogenus]|uniref:Nitroreductase family protein n=1 Tax=Streptomyces cyanogenus TaxID=80860 RepID=A0ABX7U1X5_STRCY|nr:SagB/ThcOx family dehydrogenase [Streptomyces cyanogenus]QTE03038.1 Nitroreductase family protein [Streptomyces cyanogenus]